MYFFYPADLAIVPYFKMIPFDYSKEERKKTIDMHFAVQLRKKYCFHYTKVWQGI